MVTPELQRVAAPAQQSRLGRPGWRRRYVVALLLSDVVMAAMAGTVVRLSNVDGARPIGVERYAGTALWVTALWVVALLVVGAYDVGRLAHGGVEETRRVAVATAAVVGLLCLAIVMTDGSVSRRVLLVDVPVGFCAVGLGRMAVRMAVVRHRLRGYWSDRVLAIGSPDSIRSLSAALERRRSAGMTVVAACLTDPGADPLAVGVPVVGSWTDVAEAAALVDADLVAVTGATPSARAVRELGWALERHGRQMVTATELTEIAERRVRVRPVDGLPLVWVDHPTFAGPAWVVKRAIDVVLAAFVLLLVSPVMVLIAIAIRATSEGPVIFRQHRLGKDGCSISVLKFRTMYQDAESRLAELVSSNEGDNLLYFKMREDPRITSVGKVLRRLSLDELPQLINVLNGSMSLVGPRPLVGSIEFYDNDYRRRLMVRPGMTGLWQVSGRSELSTSDAIRLDLYYVENWSLGMDLSIFARTLGAVLGSKGAY